MTMRRKLWSSVAVMGAVILVVGLAIGGALAQNEAAPAADAGGKERRGRVSRRAGQERRGHRRRAGGRPCPASRPVSPWRASARPRSAQPANGPNCSAAP